MKTVLLVIGLLAICLIYAYLIGNSGLPDWMKFYLLS